MPSVYGIFSADGVPTSNNMGGVSCNGRGSGNRGNGHQQDGGSRR